MASEARAFAVPDGIKVVRRERPPTRNHERERGEITTPGVVGVLPTFVPSTEGELQRCLRRTRSSPIIASEGRALQVSAVVTSKFNAVPERFSSPACVHAAADTRERS